MAVAHRERGPEGTLSPAGGLVRWQARLAAASLGIETAVVATAAVILAYLAVTLFLQVVFRYVLEEPLPWTEESARFALVWFAMLTGAAAARKGQHFAFRWGTLLIPERARWWLRQAVTLAVLVLLAAIVAEGIGYLRIVADQTATATQINMRIPYAAIPVGLGCFFVIYLLDFADGVLSLWTKQSFSAKERQELETYRRLGAGGDEEAPPVAAAGGPR